MTRKFISRVIRERIVDTARYRYIVAERQNATAQWIEIQRLPLESLDTTAALSEWETVYKEGQP